MPLRSLRLTLEYDGSKYFGWQTQRDQPTVQETIEQAIAKIVGEKVALHGSGRTDRGAHALGQVAHFQCDSILPTERWLAALNAHLPDDIAVLRVEEVDADFHARFSARSKTYRYRITNRTVRSPLLRARAWFVPESLDLDRMRQAAAHLVGEHDFRAFMKEGSQQKSTVRRVIRLEIERTGDDIIIEVEATGFLYTMVRAFVGCLVRVGRGRWEPESLEQVLRAGDRERVGPNTAPAQGLYLLEVQYGGSREEGAEPSPPTS